MSLWGNKDAANNAPKSQVLAGTKTAGNGVGGFANTGVNVNQRYLSAYGNVSPDVFQNGAAFGVFGVNNTEASVNRAAGKGGLTPGWTAIKFGEGPVTALTVTAAGTGFTNGETAYVTGGSVNALATVGTNATGNLTSLTITNGGSGFTNTGMVGFASGFTREKKVSAITAGGTALGYNNTSILIVSNGTINATATLATNATGGFTGGTITVTSKGFFANSKVAGDLKFTVGNSTSNSTFTGTGSIVGNTLVTAFSGTLANSSGGTFTITFGGRAGRISYEPLVAMKNMTTENTGDNSVLPNS